MLSQQRVAGLPAVVKGGPVGQPPALRAVAAFAGIAKPFAVRILVAVCTELMRHISEMQKLAIFRFGRWICLRCMTLSARCHIMFAGQDKLCIVVVEPRGRAPARHCVAGKTGRGKLAAVLIQMTARAVPLQTQKGFLEIFFFGPKAFFDCR